MPKCFGLKEFKCVYPVQVNLLPFVFQQTIQRLLKSVRLNILKKKTD